MITSSTSAVEAEREACIRILEDLRPRNDREDWTQWAKDRDELLCRAIAQISARYDDPRANPLPHTPTSG